MGKSVKIAVVESEKIDSLFEKIETLESKLSDISKNFTAKEPDPYMTKQEVAEMFKVNLNTITNWVKRGKLKRKSIGNRVYFLRSEVKTSIIDID